MEEMASVSASESVIAFFDRYQSSIAGSDPAAIATLYGESFVFAGPHGTQAVKRDDFIKVLPRRQAFVASAGLRSSKVASLEEAGIDERCVLVKAQWRLHFASEAGRAKDIDLASTYLLQQQPDGLRIVFPLDHDDLMKGVQELGLV
jgi:ketosteroid isomerase-like protein